MNKEISDGAKQLIEDLASLEHEQWSYIINYLLTLKEDELFTKLLSYQELTNMNYKDLSEEQKEKDRVWARKVLEVQWDSANKELERRKKTNGI